MACSKPSNIDWNSCLCHKSGVIELKLTKFTQSSWKTFRKAAGIRKDTMFNVLTGFLDGDP